MEDRKRLGLRIARLRAAQNLSMAELARRAGVSKPTVWAWEHGESSPRIHRAAVVAEILGVTTSDLLADITTADKISMERALHEEIRRSRMRIAELAGTSPGKVEIIIEH